MAGITMKQNDTYPPIVVQALDDAGNPVDLTGTLEVRFHLADSKGRKLFTGQGSVVNATTGVIGYNWTAGDLAVAGFFLAEFEVFRTDGRNMTVPSEEYIEVDVVKELG